MEPLEIVNKEKSMIFITFLFLIGLSHIPGQLLLRPTSFGLFTCLFTDFVEPPRNPHAFIQYVNRELNSDDESKAKKAKEEELKKGSMSHKIRHKLDRMMKNFEKPAYVPVTREQALPAAKEYFRQVNRKITI